MTVRVNAVPIFLTVSDAPGIAAPVGSRTVPEIAAVAPCACKCAAEGSMTMVRMIVREIVFIGFTRSQILYSNVALSNTWKVKFSI